MDVSPEPSWSGSHRPREFLYWRNRDRPWARALRSGLRALLGFDPAPPDELVRTLAAMYYDADPLAEAFVDEVYLAQSSARGRELLDRALAVGIDAMDDAPESLRLLFRDIERAPEWLDAEQVELGARVFRRYGTTVFDFAGAITLAGYSESSVAKPLVLSGGYVGQSTKRRFLETAAFWIAVSEPGGLLPGAPGRASALRVRIMHVFVRRRLLAHPEWDLEAWGVPISQADALLTLMGGSFAPGVALHALGFRTSRREIEALMHYWRYVGHLMGVRPRWYPETLREAVQLSYVTAVKGAGRAGEDGRRLCQSYVAAFEPEPTPSLAEKVRRVLEHRLHRATTRLFLPPWLYARNGLPPAGLWTLYPLLVFPPLFALETARRRSPRLEALVDRVARAQRRRWLLRHLGTERAEYRPSERFTR